MSNEKRKPPALGLCIGGSHHGKDLGELISAKPAVMLGTTMVRLAIEWTVAEAMKAQKAGVFDGVSAPISASYDTYHKRTDKRGVTFWIEGSLL